MAQLRGCFQYQDYVLEREKRKRKTHREGGEREREGNQAHVVSSKCLSSIFVLKGRKDF